MSRQIVSTEEKVQLQRERVPVYAARDKLKFLGLDHANFVYRLVNVTLEDNLVRFLNAGYRFVCKDAKGQPTGQHVDTFTGTDSIITKGGGKGVTLALMCIPREFYEADQKAKQGQLDVIDAEMKRDLESKADRSQGNYGKVEHLGSVFGRPFVDK